MAGTGLQHKLKLTKGALAIPEDSLGYQRINKVGNRAAMTGLLSGAVWPLCGCVFVFLAFSQENLS